MNMLVAYDIGDEKRLVRVAKILGDYGVRVQKSIFEVSFMSERFVGEMRSRIEKVIDIDEDGVKYFPLCGKCSETIEIIGQGIFTDPDSEYDIL